MRGVRGAGKLCSAVIRLVHEQQKEVGGGEGVNDEEVGVKERVKM